MHFAWWALVKSLLFAMMNKTLTEEEVTEITTGIYQ